MKFVINTLIGGAMVQATDNGQYQYILNGYIHGAAQGIPDPDNLSEVPRPCIEGNILTQSYGYNKQLALDSIKSTNYNVVDATGYLSKMGSALFFDVDICKDD